MKTRRILDGTLVLVTVALLAAAAGAQEKKAPEPSPQEKTRMEAMMKAATPGEAHKKLEALVGVFSATVKTWSDPSRPPEESSGHARNSWALDDRFVAQQFEGTLMGQSYTGVGYIGYDNLKKKYVSVWMDTSSTAVMMYTGGFDAEGKVLTLSGSADDPVTGKPVKVTLKLAIANKDSHTLEIWSSDPAGKPHKMMEITYTRD